MSAPCHCNCVDNILKSLESPRCPSCEIWQEVSYDRGLKIQSSNIELENTRADLQKYKEKFSNFRERMGVEACLDIGTAEFLSEDLNNPCSESSLKKKFSLLRNQDWPKLKRDIKRNNKPITDDVKKLIKYIFNKAKADMDTKTEELKKIFSYESEETGEVIVGKKSKCMDFAVHYFQMAVSECKPYNQELVTVIEMFPECFHALLKTCYHLGCVMALHNPPLVPAWGNEKDAFPDKMIAAETASICESTQPSCQQQDAPVNQQDGEDPVTTVHTQ